MSDDIRNNNTPPSTSAQERKVSDLFNTDIGPEDMRRLHNGNGTDSTCLNHNIVNFYFGLLRRYASVNSSEVWCYDTGYADSLELMHADETLLSTCDVPSIRNVQHVLIPWYFPQDKQWALVDVDMFKGEVFIYDPVRSDEHDAQLIDKVLPILLHMQIAFTKQAQFTRNKQPAPPWMDPYIDQTKFATYSECGEVNDQNAGVYICRIANIIVNRLQPQDHKFDQISLIADYHRRISLDIHYSRIWYTNPSL